MGARSGGRGRAPDPRGLTTAHHRLLDGAVRRRGAVRPAGPNPMWSFHRTTRWIVVLGAVALAGCRSAEEAKAPPPMDVLVTEVAQKDVPVYAGVDRHHQRLHQRRDPPAGEGLPADQELQRRRRRARRASCCSRSTRASSRRSSTRRTGDLAAGQGGAREDPARRRALHAARRGRRGQPAGARQRGAGRTRPTRRRSTPAKAQVEQAQLNLGWTKVDVADRRRRGHRHRADRRSGRADHRADHRVAGRSDQGRSSRSASRSTCACAHAHRARARRQRDRASAALELILADGSVYPHRGTVSVVDREVDPRTGTLTARGAVPQPRQHPAPGRLRQGARRRSTTLPNALVDPAARRAGPAGHVPGGGRRRRTTRSRCAPSRRAAHRQRLGDRRRGSSPASGSSSRACRRCAAA